MWRLNIKEVVGNLKFVFLLADLMEGGVVPCLKIHLTQLVSQIVEAIPLHAE